MLHLGGEGTTGKTVLNALFKKIVAIVFRGGSRWIQILFIDWCFGIFKMYFSHSPKYIFLSVKCTVITYKGGGNSKIFKRWGVWIIRIVLGKKIWNVALEMHLTCGKANFVAFGLNLWLNIFSVIEFMSSLFNNTINYMCQIIYQTQTMYTTV